LTRFVLQHDAASFLPARRQRALEHRLTLPLVLRTESGLVARLTEFGERLQAAHGEFQRIVRRDAVFPQSRKWSRSQVGVQTAIQAMHENGLAEIAMQLRNAVGGFELDAGQALGKAYAVTPVQARDQQPVDARVFEQNTRALGKHCRVRVRTTGHVDWIAERRGRRKYLRQ